MTHDLEELDHRQSNGIAVTLLWNRTSDQLLVRVADERQDEDFEFDCAHHEAQATFNHPFAFAARQPACVYHRRDLAQPTA